MLKIAICDDELISANEVNALIKRVFKSFNVEIDSSIFSLPRELVKSAQQVDYDIIFLDIDLKTDNGISVATELRLKNYSGIIIFVTSHSEFSPEGYKVDAFRYILKQNLENEIKECVNALLKKIGLIRIKIDNLDLNLNEIVYIESYNHKLTFHLSDGTKEICWNKLNTIEEIANSEQLIRVHQSYMINMKYFKDIVRYKVILIDGIEIPIPRKRYEVVKNQITIRRSLWD